jgi:hypothetical protein
VACGVGSLEPHLINLNHDHLMIERHTLVYRGCDSYISPVTFIYLIFSTVLFLSGIQSSFLPQKNEVLSQSIINIPVQRSFRSMIRF